MAKNTALIPIAEFIASVAKVQTLADGAPRFVFDAPESAVLCLSVLAEAKLQNKVLFIAIYDQTELDKAAGILTEFDDETKKSAKGKSSGVDRRRFANRRDQLARK